MEDLEKKYKEALERAKAGKPMDDVFPELKESEDEKIRQAIRYAICQSTHRDNTLICGITKDKALAWLERQKEQKPSPSIYWHAIKEGDILPCRAYLWTTNYEKYHDCFEGRLIPNVENVTVGADMWYLPVDDIRALPREGIDELPKEQEFTGRSVAEKNTDTIMSYIGLFKKQDELRDLLEKQIEQKPAEWSEEDKDVINEVASILINDENRAENKGEEDRLAYLAERIQSIRPQPHWKPSKEQPEVDIDIKQELYHHFGQVKDFTLGMAIASYFYELGQCNARK